jgi:hypothetical protein
MRQEPGLGLAVVLTRFTQRRYCGTAAASRQQQRHSRPLRV